jgi:putative restriction endonuclease
VDELALDADVRRKAFAFLANSTMSLGDTLPWKLLTHGFTYNGERVCLIGASGIWKPKILSRMPISICTAPPHPGRPAPYDDGINSSGRLSYRYRGKDPAHPDNLGLREAMENGTPLIYFFGITKGQYLATWPVFIVADNPGSLTFSVSVDDRVIRPNEGTDTNFELVREARREYITGVTVRRLHQQSFRLRVLRAYRDRCAVCRLKHIELLDAAHILPDSDPRGEPVVSNGLALCKIHHAAFDRHILGIRPDLVVEVRKDILEEIDGPMLRYGLQEMNGQRLHLPSRRVDRPATEFVEERYQLFCQAG